VRLAKKKKKKKTKRRMKKQELEDPSLREHLLAGAYGGVAKPKPKRLGVKYTTDINAGLRDIATPNAMRMDQSRRNFAVNGSLSGLEGVFESGIKMMGKTGNRGMNQSSYGRSDIGGSNLGGSRVGGRGDGAESISHLMDP
jgi:hypothetical protein